MSAIVSKQPTALPAEQGLWSRAMMAVLVSQFLSALADNALLFGALALLKMEHYPAWTQPLMQEFFIAAYIVLAPFVGPFADALPKGRVMLISNVVKLAGALGIVLGLNPFLAYGLVGAGAAAYSPAKYGILSELTSPTLLVKANGLIESSTIAAILLGAIAGGTLADWNVTGALLLVALCYAGAVLINLLIPRLAPAHRLERISLAGILRDFVRATTRLLRVPDARFSIGGTSLFWGAGATMRFLLIAWVPIALGIVNNRMPAYLNGVVAVGIVIGAALASRFVTLETVGRSLPAGVLIGVSICLLSITTHLPMAIGLLTLVGACGGFFIVPLNALLQERGHDTVGAGHAIAVQNLGENLMMLMMIGAYTLAVREGAAIPGIAAGFGALLAISIATLWRYRQRKS
ncbi:MAG TPA: lysophospholipid transporter LplT [Steroidobacteraceae bacterium]|jgi:LPLT family lysophospholipid transporter-like MFS transporter|nr:lysophospholipid transporter LplT [Steroidobacteraceae bacterium]